MGLTGPSSPGSAPPSSAKGPWAGLGPGLLPSALVPGNQEPWTRSLFYQGCPHFGGGALGKSQTAEYLFGDTELGSGKGTITISLHVPISDPMSQPVPVSPVSVLPPQPLPGLSGLWVSVCPSVSESFCAFPYLSHFPLSNLKLSWGPLASRP